MADYALLVAASKPRQRMFEHLVVGQLLGTVVVSSGDAALEAVDKQGSPALVVTELELPVLDGFKLIETLRKRHVTSPVIVISAFMEMRTIATKRQADLRLAAVLAPSMSMQTLVRTVERVFGARAPVPAAAPTDVDTEFEVEIELEPAPPGIRFDAPARLAAIESSGLVVDGPPEQELQRICEEVAREYGVETALISLVLRDRQWFKAYSGLTGALLADRGTPIDQSFCRHVVDENASLIVPDAATHPMFSDNTLVTQGLVRGYAGVPLQTAAGTIMGTLCVLDSRPMALDAAQMARLETLGRTVAAELELRINNPDRALRLKKLAASIEGSASGGGVGAALQLLEGVISTLDAGILVTDGTDQQILYANSVLGELAGIPAARIVGMSLTQWLEQNAALFDDPSDFLAMVGRLPQRPFVAREEFTVQRPVKRILRWTARPVQVNDRVLQVGIYEDVTAQRELERLQLERALVDELTGVPNRRAVQADLAKVLARARRDGSRFSVCVIDVDHFKRVNDVHGHPVGDEVLRFVARTLASSCRASDIVGRWGGEEFLVCFVGAPLETSLQLADRLRTAVEVGAPGLPTATISGGVAEWSSGDAIEKTIHAADRALYLAKHAGRNRIA